MVKNNSFKYVLTLVFIGSLNILFGQTEHPIDLALQQCLDSEENFTTKGMADCVLKALDKWDSMLNKNYNELLQLLSDTQKEKLKTSQVIWLEFRDKEIDFSNQLYYDMQGTMWHTIATDRKLELTKNRALELSGYISNLSAK